MTQRFSKLWLKDGVKVGDVRRPSAYMTDKVSYLTTESSGGVIDSTITLEGETVAWRHIDSGRVILFPWSSAAFGEPLREVREAKAVRA